MKCKDCPAARADQTEKVQCRAGIYPYVLFSSGKLGCCCNRKQVERYMKDEGGRGDG